MERLKALDIMRGLTVALMIMVNTALWGTPVYGQLQHTPWHRLNAAAEALHTTDETVLTIASRCGFENLSYFNRAFKKHFGMTPREYRKK